ncbi:DUF456 domain-containing protein [Balneolaceae bacterium YR4-1]|uniref:DUF456 domain-containing protein n=1 Tax=Halalkalibaculum roseum TaxID=2709311 RepID=A0A6M1T2P7_9BACT|nr:DUF456 domain-containing protein [Halalkalibaculum roseum]NGP77784.1 DUF456 domain-containing protein [Halalkalibaculum roseum]
METIIIILGALLILAGLLGSFLPVLPGPPISYIGLILLQLTSTPPFTIQFLAVWALIVIAIMILDNVVPAWGARKYGGSPFGVWGSILGLIAGFFFPPMGIIIGPIVGAFVGELAGGKTSDQALKAAWGSFLGFLAGTLMKVIACGMMGYYFFVNM